MPWPGEGFLLKYAQQKEEEGNVVRAEEVRRRVICRFPFSDV